jgi:HTH-type transcriptional regulator / antitoxin HigA
MQPALFDSKPQHPGKILRQMMEARGWTQDDLAQIIGKSRQAVNEIIAGRNGIGLEMAVLLATAFKNSPQEWLSLDHQYRLSLSEQNLSDVGMMASLYSAAPVREMIKRGWIRPAQTADELRKELAVFFEADPIDRGVSIPVATRRMTALPSLTPPEIAWCYRARQLARNLPAERFNPGQIEKTRSALRRLAVHPKEARHLGRLLADHGIRFVVIEPLAGAAIDGAALWDEIGPIIAVSIRTDRIDGFWFTVMHEFEHIKNQDPISVDSGMVDAVHGITVALVNDVAEDRANLGAANSLIPDLEMESFMRRVGPLYSKERIMQFSNRMKIHPGIIVGQLQHRKELGYSALRNQLVKIREFVISTALTDGWGHISPVAL